ncbi:hypothetical protein JCM10449v2_004149 [Rhodotorula kratochvilovae]
MSRRDSKDWRRSRTLSTVFFEAPAQSSLALVRTRLRPLLVPAVVALLVLVCLALSRADSADPDLGSSAAQPPTPAVGAAQAGEHPNFDFDAHVEQHEAPRRVLGEDEDESGAASEGADDAEAVGDEDAVEEAEIDVQDEVELVSAARAAAQARSTLAQPFLPFTCEPCAAVSPFHPAPPTCAKYRGASPSSSSSSPAAGAARASALHPDILDHSVLFAGTGSEVRRVLKRAMRSSLYGAKRVREGKEEELQRYEDEEPFRILVLGGSVSNCRGVDPKTDCWHAHVLRWFQQNLPMEGDRDLVPEQPSLLVSNDAPPLLPIIDARQREKRVAIPAGSASSISSSPHPPHLEKRAAPVKRKKKKVKSKKTKSRTASSRRKPSTKLINGSKSATGSAFFAYCFDEEMTLRRKNIDWGLGPDLIVLETGVNDVWPGGERATRDFEKLLRTLRSMPSKPAIIALEAASLLLASTTSMSMNAEYDHLPAAHFYDVPVLSVKQALFGSVAGLASTPPTPSSADSPVSKIDDLFLPDLHHPNERGHELLADVLISYLEQQACLAQSELLAVADARIRGSPSRLLTSASSEHDAAHHVDPALDFPRRKEEAVRPLPARSLFTPFAFDKKGKKKEEHWELPPPRCIQVGNAKTTVEPVKNRGWTKLAWARDKQYLVADKPGASVTFRVEVGKGGTVMADWLHSRFYDLGDITVYLDGDKTNSVKVAGYWDLGWSIGVPTEVFTGVAPGPHDVTFEVLPASESSHPSRKTNFRLIGLIAT